MSQPNLIFIGIALAGFIIIIYALIKHSSLSGKQILDSKWKEGHLKTNAFGTVLLAGIIVFGVGIYLLSKGYEKEIKTLNNELSGTRDALKVFKQYDLRMRLEFPEKSSWNPIKKNKIKGYVQKSEDYDFKKVKIKCLTDSGGAVVYFKKLSKGDILKVRVTQDNNTWESNNITIPTVQLNMELIKTVSLEK